MVFSCARALLVHHLGCPGGKLQSCRRLLHVGRRRGAANVHQHFGSATHCVAQQPSELMIPVGHMPPSASNSLDNAAQGTQGFVDLDGLLLQVACHLRLLQPLTASEVAESQLAARPASFCGQPHCEHHVGARAVCIHRMLCNNTLRQALLQDLQQLRGLLGHQLREPIHLHTALRIDAYFHARALPACAVDRAKEIDEVIVVELQGRAGDSDLASLPVFVVRESSKNLANHVLHQAILIFASKQCVGLPSAGLPIGHHRHIVAIHGRLHQIPAVLKDLLDDLLRGIWAKHAVELEHLWRQVRQRNFNTGGVQRHHRVCTVLGLLLGTERPDAAGDPELAFHILKCIVQAPPLLLCHAAFHSRQLCLLCCS
mmetsp:Transcript_110648/g.263790  ORF Transcript_110648/g.263790 Transcript_110648/m.263790 type:complete len:371 (+) Transcript_110648:92-1204(+)